MTLKSKLLDTEKKKLIDLTQSNIDKAGGDKALGIKNTQDYLATQKTSTGANVLDTAKSKFANENKVPTGYASNPTESAINTQEMKATGDYLKSPTPIITSPTGTPPVIPPAGDGVTGAPTGNLPIIQSNGTGTTGIPSPIPTGVTSTGDVLDTNGDGVIQSTELTGEYKTFYDGMSEIEKKQFEAVGENARKQGQDVAKAYANYMRDYGIAKNRATQDEKDRLAKQGIVDEINQIQDSQTLRKAKQSVDKLKQSVAYLGTLGVPGKSQTALNGVQSQIDEANKTYGELVNLQSLVNSARKADQVTLARQYENQMEDLTTKLNDDIDKSIQGAYNSLVAADQNGQLDTPQEIEAFRVKMLTDLDSNITGISQANIEQRKFLIERYDNIVKEEQTKQTNKNTINKEMSAVQGYYVDGNGDPIISSTTGQRINIPPEAPMDPVFDKTTGQLITFAKDATTGVITANVDQVIDQPTFEEQTIQNYAKLYTDGRISLSDMQNMGLGRDLISSIVNQSSSMTPTEKPMTPKEKLQYDLDVKKFGLDVAKQNLELKKYLDEQGSGESLIISDPQSIIEYSTNKRGTTNLQCGQFVNDYIEQITGTKGGMGNDYQSKINALSNIGVSDTPQVGGIFVYGDQNSKNGHTGIIQSINGDKITVIDANRENTKEGSTPTLHTYTINDKYKFSQPILKPEKLTDKEFTQSNQIITSFKSDPQVKAFEEAYSQGLNLISSLETGTGPGDVAGIFQFMKTLDPQSVVRETEFEVAASSAGLATKLGNMYSKVSEGKLLSEEQAKQFGDLAKQFILNKSKLYDQKYKDGVRRLEQQGIDINVFPTSTADEMRKILNTTSTGNKPIADRIAELRKNREK